MNTFINYLIEANIGLCLFILLYVIVLKNETDFRIKRAIMLSGMIASVIFPILHFNLQNSAIPALNEFVPMYLLPEIVIGDNNSAASTAQSLLWTIIHYTYLGGVLFFGLLFSYRIFRLAQLIHSSSTRPYHDFIIAESASSKLTFSFFHFIFIGQAGSISDDEKQQILHHESIHARQWHSLDILLIHLLGIVFWFNPLIRFYKKIFIQLHEFEADARAVEIHEVNKYCSLLARVALQSADFPIANHFNQSLTLKRIAMMQTMKTKIKKWKVALTIAAFPAFFVLVACQEQLVENMKTIEKSSAVSLDIPADVQARIDELKKASPEKDFAVIETTTEEGKQTLDKMDANQISSLNIIKNRQDGRSFIIVERNSQNINLALSSSTDKIYTLVEHQPEYVGGMDAMKEFIASHMQYPEEARKKGIEGTTFISFIVNTDGSISDVLPVKGISPECDAEAIRVIKSMPNWIPGKQSGKIVNVRFVMPIKFALG